MATQQSDVVCVILCGNVPFISTRTHIKSNYRLVGESYVHYIIDGEAVEMWLNSDIVKKNYQFCMTGDNISLIRYSTSKSNRPWMFHAAPSLN